MVIFNAKIVSGAVVLLLSAVSAQANSNAARDEVTSSKSVNLAASLKVLATIPNNCETVCDGVVNTLTTTCATFACICNTTTTTDIHTCVNCLIAVKPANQTIINEAQAILDQYALICNAGGVSVPFQTASGFTGSVGPPPSQATAISPPFTGSVITTDASGSTFTVPPTGTGTGAASLGSGGTGTTVNGTGAGSVNGTGTGSASASTSTGTTTAPPNSASDLHLGSGYRLWFGVLIGAVIVLVGDGF